MLPFLDSVDLVQGGKKRLLVRFFFQTSLFQGLMFYKFEFFFVGIFFEVFLMCVCVYFLSFLQVLIYSVGVPCQNWKKKNIGSLILYYSLLERGSLYAIFLFFLESLFIFIFFHLHDLLLYSLTLHHLDPFFIYIYCYYIKGSRW